MDFDLFEGIIGQFNQKTPLKIADENKVYSDDSNLKIQQNLANNFNNTQPLNASINLLDMDINESYTINNSSMVSDQLNPQIFQNNFNFK
jgi:hypothetical protein